MTTTPPPIITLDDVRDAAARLKGVAHRTPVLRSRTLGPGAAFTAAGFGFFLASTGAAKPINTLAASLIETVQNL